MRLSVLVSTQAFFICFMILKKFKQCFQKDQFLISLGCEHMRWKEEQLEVQVLSYEEPNN